MTDQTQHLQRHLDALRAGATAAAGLKEALDRVGVNLPSLTGTPPVQERAHVELGGCAAGVATKLAEVINAAADAHPDLRATDARAAE